MVERAIQFLVFDNETHNRWVLCRVDQLRVLLVRGYKPMVLAPVAETERKKLSFRPRDRSQASEYPVVMLFVPYEEGDRYMRMEVEEVGALMDYILQRKSGSVVLQ